MEEQAVKTLIDNKDYKGIEAALSNHPHLANEGIAYDNVNTAKAHPLHRICDGVFSGKYNEEEGVRMAKMFLAHGAKINGNALMEKQDTPLIAAASLHADKLAIYYMEIGADIHHAGCHGGTALHWAAWCGRHTVVARLVKEGAAVNRKCIDFKATPLFWAVHGLKSGGNHSLHDCLACVKILLQSGADKNISNADGKNPVDLLHEEDAALKELLTNGQ